MFNNFSCLISDLSTRVSCLPQWARPTNNQGLQPHLAPRPSLLGDGGRPPHLHSDSRLKRLKNSALNQEKAQYHRMKTVFGHANFREGNSTPVYNTKFDMSDRVIITGADDG